jgi:O-antigen/teichoic acid export membrane protein
MNGASLSLRRWHGGLLQFNCAALSMKKLFDKLSSLGLPAANISLRGLSLVARFALTLFMARYFTLGEIGLFGLFYSAAAAAPAFLGFGMNYFLNREIVGIPFDSALRRLRDRVAVSVAVATFVVFAFWLFEVAGAIPSITHLALLCPILILEAVALDIHYSLISLKRPLLANSLLFVRSAVWVFPYIVVAAVFPQSRNLGVLLWWWLAAIGVSFAVLAWHMRSWPWAEAGCYGFDVAWFRKTLAKSKLIYASDIGIVGTMFADRYILGSLSGLQQVGVFVFFWTIANSVQVLVGTAISQIVVPHMVEAHAAGGHAALHQILKRKTAEAAGLGIALSFMAIVAVYLVVPYLGHQEFGANINLLLILLVAAIIRSVSDVWNVALYSAGKDAAWAWINIFGLISTSLACFVGLNLAGMLGLAVATVVVAVLQWFARVYFLSTNR